MKVALVRKEFTRSWGGAESYAVSLATELVARGHEVHVFANTWDTPADTPITFHRIPMIDFYSPFKNLSFAFNTKRALAGERFDIVNSLSQMYPQDIYRMGDGLHRHLFTVQFPHPLTKFFQHLNPRHRAILFVENRIFKSTNYSHIVANSKLCKQQAYTYYRVPADRIEVIYNGVDSERFNPALRETYRSDLRNQLSIGDHETVLLFVSRNFKRKGLIPLIKSISLMGNKAAALKVLVVGRGNPRPYQGLADRQGVAGRLLFVGEEKNIEKYYGASDFLVLPTLYDPFSNVCLEALACGLPVITTESNGAAEIITQGKNGYTVEDADDAKTLAHRITLLLSHDTREAMARNARSTAQHYTTGENTQKTIALYEKVLAQKKALACSSHEGLIINDTYRSLLAQNKLLDFNTLMHYRHGIPVKQVRKERSTVKLMLNDTTGTVGAYLKRYHTSAIKTVTDWLFHFSFPRTALHEWNTIRAFHRLGIPTMIHLAVGLPQGTGLQKDSFLLTKEIEGIERLDHYLPRNYSPPLHTSHIKEKRSLLKELAQLVKRLHRLGFNHRDLYLCHILVKKEPPHTWKIYFADLHRVDYRKKVRLRWKVKDLAALNYSADRNTITRTDRLRFIKYYLGEQKLTANLKSVIKKVLRKTDKICSHNLKLQEKALHN
jgi:UDP-glucose:(heptosyl)LPS alpha-1,3-glucosyltransferase